MFHGGGQGPKLGCRATGKKYGLSLTPLRTIIEEVPLYGLSLTPLRKIIKEEYVQL
jgi:uncharacterized protein (UPF0262 family)